LAAPLQIVHGTLDTFAAPVQNYALPAGNIGAEGPLMLLVR